MAFTGEGSEVTIHRDDYRLVQKKAHLWDLVQEALANGQYVPGVLSCVDTEQIDLESPPLVLEDLVQVPEVDMAHVDEIIRTAQAEKSNRGVLFLNDCVLSAEEWLDGVGDDNLDADQRMRLAAAAAYCLLGMDLVPKESDGEI